MTSLRMTSHCMTSRCGVLSLLGLCQKDCSINMLNFNKLRFIVYEIFDNSQLFFFYIFTFLSHLFPLPCGASSTVPREGFDSSVIMPFSWCVVAVTLPI